MQCDPVVIDLSMNEQKADWFTKVRQVAAQCRNAYLYDGGLQQSVCCCLITVLW